MKPIFLILLLFIALGNAAYAADAPKLITNRDASGDKVLLPVEEKPLTHNIYDLSFVAYDAAFAKEFGLADEHVTEMDKHLRYMEIRMVTEGQQTNCYYNLIIDKAVAIDFPEENFYHQGFTPELNLPIKLPFSTETYQHFAELRAGSKIMVDQRFNNRTYKGNRGFKFHTSGVPFTDGAYGGAGVQYYIQDRPVPFHILSTQSSCQEHLYDYPELAFWIRKKGRPDTIGPVLKDYHTFLIPNYLAKQVYPFLKAYTAIENERFRKPLNQQ